MQEERWADTAAHLHSGHGEQGMLGSRSSQFRGCSGEDGLKCESEQEPERPSVFVLETLPCGGNSKYKIPWDGYNLNV